MSKISKISQKDIFGDSKIINESPTVIDVDLSKIDKPVSSHSDKMNCKKPEINKMTPAYNPERAVNNISKLDSRSELEILETLVKIRSQLRMIQNFGVIKISPHYANDPYFLEKCISEIKVVIDKLSRL